MSRNVEIFCPKCTWHPVPADKWYCICSHTWNTFETGGVCPACGKAWAVTACLSCHCYSPHEAWYHETCSETVHEKNQDKKPIGFR